MVELSRGGTSVKHRPFGIEAALLLVLFVACCGLSGCGLRLTSAPADVPFELEIMHVNDTHSYVAGMDKHGGACLDPAEPCVGGLGRLAAELRRLRADRDNVLVLDAGDRFQGTLFYTVNKWPMLAELDGLVGYDATTLGNHEFDEGCDVLADYIRALDTPVLAANLEPGPACPLRGLEGVRPYEVRDVAGRKVGLVGLANPDAVRLAAPCADTRFTDSAEALRSAVAELDRQGVDIIVAVTHLGLSADRDLARTVEGVDVIVGGHSHSWLASGPVPDLAAPGAEGPYPVVERSPIGFTAAVARLGGPIAARAVQRLSR